MTLPTAKSKAKINEGKSARNTTRTERREVKRLEKKRRIGRKSQVIPIVALDQKSVTLGEGTRDESGGDEKVGSGRSDVD